MGALKNAHHDELEYRRALEDGEGGYHASCPECDGVGEWTTVAPVRGEAIDADYVEHRCPECNGTGEQEELLCEGCDKPLPQDGLCFDCMEPVERAIAEFNASHSGDYARLPILATDCDYEIVRRSGVQGMAI